MIAFRRRCPLLAPLVSSTAVGKTSVVAKRPPVACSSNGSSFQLTCREKNRASPVVANAAYQRTNTLGGVVGLTYRSLVFDVTACLWARIAATELLRDWCDDHRSAVAEHLGDTLHELRRVVSHSDHRVRTHLLRMIEHHVEG